MSSTTRHIKAAFEDRIRTQLETDYPVQYPGDDFNPKDHSEWVKVEDLGYTPIAVSGAGGKRVQSWTFQVGCFADVDGDEDSGHRVWEIVDDVVDAFRFVGIDVKDLTQDAEPKLGELDFLMPDAEPVSMANDPDASGDHVSVTIPAHYDDL